MSKKIVLGAFIVLLVAVLSVFTGCKIVDDSSAEKTYHVSYDLNGAAMLSEDATLDKDLPEGSIIEFNQELYDQLSNFNLIFPPVNQEVDYFEINGEKYGKGSTYKVNSDVTIKLIFKPCEGYHWVTKDLNGGTYIDSRSEEMDKVSCYSTINLYDLSLFIVPPTGKVWDGAMINDERYYVGDSVTITEDSTMKYFWKDKMTLDDFEYREEDKKIIITGVKDENIKGIEIPEGVSRIDDYAFSNCKSLNSVFMPNTVTSLGDGVFMECTSLKYAVLSTKLDTLSSGLFSNCSSLANVYIPTNVKRIESFAFSGCSSLKKIQVSNKTEFIGDCAFADCDSANYTEYENGLYLGSFDNPYLIYMKPLNKEITDIRFNAKTKFIHSNAFEECNSLNNVVIPEHIISIGSSAFKNCMALSNITIPNSVKFLGVYAFSGCTAIKKITIPESITVIEQGLFNGCTLLEEVDIPDSVTEIGVSAFFGCKALKEINLPDNLMDIGDMAFSSCSSLTSIVIPNKIEQIGMYTFNECTNLKNVTLPEGLKTIIFNAFEKCDELESITLPSTIEKIGREVFKDCTKLSTITFNGTKEMWDSVSKGKLWVDDESKVDIICNELGN